MSRWIHRVIYFIVVPALVWILIWNNRSDPRVDVNDFHLTQLPEDTLVLLEGGRTVTDDQGRERYRLTLRWEGEGCLFIPKAAWEELLVNGTAWDDLADSQRRLFQFSDAPNADHIYQIEIVPVRDSIVRYGDCLYLGTLSAVTACLSRQIISRYFVTGICFCIALFSLILFLWKRSEQYLFWLAVYGFLMMLRTQDALGLGIFMDEKSDLYQTIFYVISYNNIFRTCFHLLTALLSCQVMRHYLSVKLFGHSVMVYILGAALLEVAGTQFLNMPFFAELLNYMVFYGSHMLCIEKEQGLSAPERHILSAAWVIAMALQLFSLLSIHDMIPHGDLDLQLHIMPALTATPVVFFFIVACRRFAVKFQEADNLNLHLEAAIQEKTREQTALIRSMLHNLKTPLFSLVGYTDMAKETLALNPESVPRYLDKIQDKSKYVSHMVDHLFFLTQLDANQLVFQRLPVRLEDILRSVEENTLLKGREKGIRVSLTPPQNAFCMGDPLYLQQAFQNIADNATEHMEPGGTLTISAAQESAVWKISFQDTGCGIPAEDLPKIFDRYYSNHYGRRSSSGLGLAIAREIIEHHGGGITADSEPGRGTCITVSIPFSSGEQT